MSQHKINVTLKAGGGYDAPWVTIGGDSEAEAAFNLKAVVPGSEADDFFALVAEAAASLKGFYTATDQLGATAQAADPTAPWDKPQPAAPAFAVAQPQYAVVDPGASNYANSPGAPVTPAAPAGGPRDVADKWGNVYTYDRPDAPQTLRGPALVKTWTSQAGKVCKRWVDPAAGPEWFAARKPKVDKAEQWEGGWAD